MTFRLMLRRDEDNGGYNAAHWPTTPYNALFRNHSPHSLAATKCLLPCLLSRNSYALLITGSKHGQTRSQSPREPRSCVSKPLPQPRLSVPTSDFSGETACGNNFWSTSANRLKRPIQTRDLRWNYSSNNFLIRRSQVGVHAAR